MPDLKYSMQHMMMKVLYQRNPKAAIKALDQLIKDCTASVSFLPPSDIHLTTFADINIYIGHMRLGS